MKIKTLVLTLTLGLAAAAVCLAGDTKAEQALRDADAAWSKAAASKDLDKGGHLGSRRRFEEFSEARIEAAPA